MSATDEGNALNVEYPPITKPARNIHLQVWFYIISFLNFKMQDVKHIPRFR